MEKTAYIPKSDKTVKNITRPKPLKIGGVFRQSSTDHSVEHMYKDVESVVSALHSGKYDNTIGLSVHTMCKTLKIYGPQLENVYKDQLDKLFVNIRNICRNSSIEATIRLFLLEMVELRACNWATPDRVSDYYVQKGKDVEVSETVETPSPFHQVNDMMSADAPPVSLLPGEVLRESGKYPKPTKIPGKNFLKDEIVIRNSDSGKVNVGAKERLVQIAGAGEENIRTAKQLIEKTIRRNASPIRTNSTMESALVHSKFGGSTGSLDDAEHSDNIYHRGSRHSANRRSSTHEEEHGAPIEYKYTVTVGEHSIKITGQNLELVQTAKLMLDEYFTNAWTEDVDDVDTLLAQNSSSSNSEDAYQGFLNRSSMSPTSPLSDGDITVIHNSMFTTSPKEHMETKLQNGNTRHATLPRTSSKSPEIHKPNKNKTIIVTSLYTDTDWKVRRELLLLCAKSSICREPPIGWERVLQEVPEVIKAAEFFDPQPYLNKEIKFDVHLRGESADRE